MASNADDDIITTLRSIVAAKLLDVALYVAPRQEKVQFAKAIIYLFDLLKQTNRMDDPREIGKTRRGA